MRWKRKCKRFKKEDRRGGKKRGQKYKTKGRHTVGKNDRGMEGIGGGERDSRSVREMEEEIGEMRVRMWKKEEDVEGEVHRVFLIFTLSALGCTLTYGSGTGSCLLFLPLLLRRPPELM